MTDGITLDKLRAAMDLIKDIPPSPEFYSSKNFPASNAIQLTNSKGAKVIYAHPDFWEKVKAKTKPSTYDVNPWLLPVVINLDVHND